MVADGPPVRGLAGGDAPAAPDGCPWHHLPPNLRVTVPGRQGSAHAGVMCDDHHRQAVAARITRTLAFPAGHTILPPAFRRPAPPDDDDDDDDDGPRVHMAAGTSRVTHLPRRRPR